MAKKYLSRNMKSEVLVSDYIDGTRTLNKVIGNTVLLYLMADDSLDSITYRRLTTSARAIRDHNKPRKRKSDARYTGEQYLFEDEDLALLMGDEYEQ